MLFLPVKMMKSSKGPIEVGKCLPLNKAEVLHSASEDSVKAGKAVTVLTYLHGVAEAQKALKEVNEQVCDPATTAYTHLY
jgi:pyruvate/2-oxoglutarate/acetoin dehydrogenase E1 component